MNAPIQILIVDDHAIVREGLRTLLAEEPAVQVVGEAAEGATAVRLAQALRPQVILMDLVMPDMDGIEATRQIRSLDLPCHVLVLTSFAEDRRVHEAIQSGATGYLLKDVLKDDLLRAIEAAARGEPTMHPEVQRRLFRQIGRQEEASRLSQLTPREQDVLRLITQGKNNREIADSLSLSEGTVKDYVSAILGKLAVADRTQAALFAVKHGFVEL